MTHFMLANGPANVQMFYDMVFSVIVFGGASSENNVGSLKELIARILDKSRKKAKGLSSAMIKKEIGTYENHFEFLSLPILLFYLISFLFLVNFYI